MSLLSLAALIMDIVVVAVVKAITRRRRPVANKDSEMFVAVSVDKFSFPSGHCTRAVMLSVLFPLQVSQCAVRFSIIIECLYICVK